MSVVLAIAESRLDSSVEKVLANGNILVGVDENGASVGSPGKSGWPSRSPDLNIMDEFIWGIMVSHMKFCDATTKAGLKRELERVWREEITLVIERRELTLVWGMPHDHRSYSMYTLQNTIRYSKQPVRLDSLTCTAVH